MKFSVPVYFSKAAAVALGLCLLATPPTAQAQQRDEIVLTITSVRAIDRADIFGRADFYAQVTIDGDTVNTPVVRQTDSARPNWAVSKVVRRGNHAIRIRLLDKDPGKPDDVIDINRVPNKRDLDFTLNTGSCRISGFSSAYRCRQTIRRAGTEPKKAEIEFSVLVKR
jgi:hypothetical protein